MSSATTALSRVLVGEPMRSDRLEETLLPKRLALPVFCSDPLSSVAYATEQILLVLAARWPVAAVPDALGRRWESWLCW